MPLLHHTLHFFSGFIPRPAGQLKASENSFIFDSVPMTLKKKKKEKNISGYLLQTPTCSVFSRSKGETNLVPSVSPPPPPCLTICTAYYGLPLYIGH